MMLVYKQCTKHGALSTAVSDHKDKKCLDTIRSNFIRPKHTGSAREKIPKKRQDRRAATEQTTHWFMIDFILLF